MRKKEKQEKMRKNGLRVVTEALTVVLLILSAGLTFLANLMFTKWKKRPFGQLK